MRYVLVSVPTGTRMLYQCRTSITSLDNGSFNRSIASLIKKEAAKLHLEIFMMWSLSTAIVKVREENRMDFQIIFY